MYVVCTFNYGFEDVLTEGNTYEVLAIGENSYQIKDDMGNIRWYGQTNLQLERP